MAEPDDDLPLVRDIPRRADPGSAGRRRLAGISQTIGLVWTGFWWFLAPTDGNARYIVGAAGIALIGVARFMLQTKGAALLDVSHLQLELREAAVPRGGSAQVTLRVVEPGKVRGKIDVAIACHETWAYRRDSDSHGSSRATGEQQVWQHPRLLEPLPVQTVDFEIPAGLPFSWDGNLVTFRWTITATERVERGLDPTIELPLKVTP